MKNWYTIALVLLLVAGLIYYHSLSLPLFTSPYSTVLEDQRGHLLGAAIAADGQWRFPQTDSLSPTFVTAITYFEDRQFFRHPGVDLLALARAAWQNLRAGYVVSGGSTLTMQTIRLSRGRDRTLIEKFVEIILATRLEWALSKEDILRVYASHAPFGGNVVGIDAAAWRYYGVSPHQLSWAENALLAVLPNSPSLLYPGKNAQRLMDKRNRLLHKLWQHGQMDSLTYALAISEPLPEAPHPLPSLAPHLLTRLINEGYQGRRAVTTLQAGLQQQVTRVVDRHHQTLQGNGIHNAAVLVADVATGEVQAYVGNTRTAPEHGASVDIITARRSPGSLLKPLLYAAMLHEGSILPKSLQPDVPTFIDGFAPQNFDQQFEGAVPADQVIARSLNVPSVHMLRAYGVEKFHHLLTQMGMTTLDQPPGHYGLSLIIGGSEGSLWDITGMYASMARTLNQYFKYPEPHRYAPVDIHPLTYRPAGVSTSSKRTPQGYLNAAPLWFTFRAMLEVARPEAEAGWQYFASARKVAWKTGTSHGHRDAWAVGVTPRYVVGVWVGNADGEGRPSLTGVNVAAPLLFDVVNLMPASGWFDVPRSDMVEALVSRQSGYRAPPHYQDTLRTLIPRAGLRTPVSPYYQRVHLDSSRTYQVHADCEPASHLQSELWFVLPPVQEWYYRRQHPSYRPLPPFRPDCHSPTIAHSSLDLIYPKPNATVYLPRKLDGTLSRTVFEAVHRDTQAGIFWHVDDQYIGETHRDHQMALALEPGVHTLTLVDQKGVTIKRQFTILRAEE